MASSMNDDSDSQISQEDQLKINKFATCNTRLEDIREELKNKENDLVNLHDAEDEMMLALDADEKLPYLLGEVFVYKSQDSASESIAKEREVLNEEITQLKAKAAELDGTMGELKAHLYGKFGNNINLEAEDE